MVLFMLPRQHDAEFIVYFLNLNLKGVKKSDKFSVA